MLRLAQRGAMGSVVVANDQSAVLILDVIGLHQPGFGLCGVHKLPEVQFG